MEAFGILMSVVIIFTIIFVALHCGGTPAIKVRPTSTVEAGGRHTQSNAIFAARGGGGGGGARSKGPVGHV